MNTAVRHKGTVTYFSLHGSTALIDSQGQEDILFHPFKKGPITNAQGQKLKGTLLRGYEVEFSVKETGNATQPFEAYDVELLNNVKLETLMGYANDDVPLQGYLKFIDGNFYIKDLATSIMMRVKISIWEIDLKRVYDERINRIVVYTITGNTPRYMRAVLTDRKYSPAYWAVSTAAESNETPRVIICGHSLKGFRGSLVESRTKIHINVPLGYMVVFPFNKGDTMDIVIELMPDGDFRIRPLLLKKLSPEAFQLLRAAA